ncbi:trypsin-1 [Periplaneta americana]|uniref:trypsin-1 n=1 Tax=Periplaneta americana TaxID=6978 RepID=UPI0037E7C1F6
MQSFTWLLQLSLLFTFSGLIYSGVLSDSFEQTPSHQSQVNVGESKQPGLELLTWPFENFNNVSRRFIRQLGVRVHNTAARILGLLKPDEAHQECTTPSGKKGRCRHLQYCLFGEHRTFQGLLDYKCIIQQRYVGVCCPEGQENSGPDAGDGGSLPGSETAGQLPAIDPGLPGGGPGISFPGEASAGDASSTPAPDPDTNSTQPQVRGCGVSTVQGTRIVGGQPAVPKEWPWMAALLRERTIQYCGGVLITDLHVLTAAHCVNRRATKDVRVRLGEYDFTRKDETRAQDFGVVDIRMHADFSSSTYENDIAILKLQRRAAFNSYIWPICLPPPGPTFENAIAIVTGWGTVSYGGPSSDVLMEVAVPVWNQARCRARFTQPILNTTLCAGEYGGGKDSCQGDSGGPLMLQLDSGRWATIGVVSWGVRCGEPNTPGIYTRVNEYLQWIVENSVF